MPTDEIRKMLDENVTLPLWPEAGKVLDLKRDSAYAAAAAGQIRTLRYRPAYEGSDCMAAGTTRAYREASRLMRKRKDPPGAQAGRIVFTSRIEQCLLIPKQTAL